MSQHYIDIHDKYETQFDEDVDLIFEEHEFFTDYEYDYFPETTNEKYELLKASSGKWFFLKHKLDFLKLAIRDDNRFAIVGKKQELEDIINHEKIKNPVEFNKLYMAAIKYISDTVVKQKSDVVYSNEDITLYLYILHKTGYFQDFFLVPDRAMGIDYTKNKVELIPEVYGKYFLLYDYLSDKAAELGITENGVILETPNKPQVAAVKPAKRGSKIRQMKGQSLMDIWEQGRMGAYYKVIKALQDFKFENGKKMVEKRENRLYWLPHPSPKKWQMYLAAFIYEVESAKLISPEKYNGSIPVLQEILKGTFNIPALSADSFNAIKNSADAVYSEYKKPFKKIIRGIKSENENL